MLPENYLTRDDYKEEWEGIDDEFQLKCLNTGLKHFTDGKLCYESLRVVSEPVPERDVLDRTDNVLFLLRAVYKEAETLQARHVNGSAVTDILMHHGAQPSEASVCEMRDAELELVAMSRTLAEMTKDLLKKTLVYRMKVEDIEGKIFF